MRLTLRFVIGALSSLMALVVAVITLAITYSVSLATVRDIGRQHSIALATMAEVQVTEYFDLPVRHLDFLAATHKLNDTDMPSNLPLAQQLSPNPHETMFYTLYTCSMDANFTYTVLGCIYEDGSSNTIYITDDDYLRFESRFVRNWPAGDMIGNLREVSLATKQERLNGSMVVNVWGQFAAYATAKLVAGRDPRGLWYTVSLYIAGTSSKVFFVLPAAKPIYNQTNQFIGFASLGRPLAKINDFLLNVKGTPNTHVFAVDLEGRIIASTHPTPFYTITEVVRGTALQKGCATTADTAYSTTNSREYHGCRTMASAFSAYPPLVKVAGDTSFLQSQTKQAKLLDVSGSNYFVVSTPVSNSYRLWGLNIVLCMPESDILGDIVKGRNTAIGITAGVFVAAAILSVCLTYVLLQPVSDVSKRMLDTARLRETEDERSYSRLAEIRDLQKAYTNMNTAIKSFTRYVPRDVVKDLMASGQLCTIQMIPQICTMLFVDIAGFTTICERVPPDQLSELVSQYFDRASRIVMDHDGLIDKFIGDCIMAVWGAPFAVANQEVKAVLTGKLLDRACMVEPLSKSWDEAGEQLRVRVGISTGEVLAGNMGSADRMNYTVIGDPVNLAARLESMNKQFDTRVMVSEMTAEGLGGAFVLRLLMPIAVVGKDKPVKVYEVVGTHINVSPEDTQWLNSREYGDFANAEVDVETSSVDVTSQTSFAAEDSMAPPARQVSSLGDVQNSSEIIVAGGAAAAGGARRLRRSRRSAVNMIRDAVFSTRSEVPLCCTDEEIDYAAKLTTAVQAYMRQDFKTAIDIIDTAMRRASRTLLYGEAANNNSADDTAAGSSGSGAPIVSRSTSAARSSLLVRNLCEQYLREGCPPDFDGVYRALEK